MRSLAWVVVGVLLASPAVALLPLDNDAGSGGDAPDVAPLAVHVEFPSSFTGTLSRPADIDYYAFEADAGDVLEFTVEASEIAIFNFYTPSGHAYEAIFAHDPPQWVLFNETGDWVLEVVYGALSPIPYRITASVLDVAFATSLSSSERWTLYTISWAEGAGPRVFHRIAPGLDLLTPSNDIFIWQADYETGPAAARKHIHRDSWIGISSTGIGSEVEAQGLASLEVPSFRAPPTGPLAGLAPAGWAQGSPEFPADSNGTLRLVQMMADGEGIAHVDIMADAPVTVQRESGRGFVAWGDPDAPGIKAPGYARLDENEITVELASGFTGQISLGAADHAWFRGPDGVRHDLFACCGSYAILIGTGGPLTVHVDAQENLVTSSSLHLAGAAGGTGWTPALYV